MGDGEEAAALAVQEALEALPDSIALYFHGKTASVMSEPEFGQAGIGPIPTEICIGSIDTPNSSAGGCRGVLAGGKDKAPASRITLWIVRPDMKRICIIQPIEDLGVRQARTMEALKQAVSKARAELGVPESQLQLCK